jgi:hypothetical protein
VGVAGVMAYHPPVGFTIKEVISIEQIFIVLRQKQ